MMPIGSNLACMFSQCACFLQYLQFNLMNPKLVCVCVHSLADYISGTFKKSQVWLGSVNALLHLDQNQVDLICLIHLKRWVLLHLQMN